MVLGDASISTDLSLDYVFQVGTTQTYTYTILGEVSKTTYADETITLDIPRTKMNRLLTYNSNWLYAPGTTGGTGDIYQPLPTVALRLSTVIGDTLNALLAGLTGDTSSAYPAIDGKSRVDGDNSTTCKSLVSQFQDVNGFTFGGGSDNLAKIPVEAIERFQSSDISTPPLSTVLTDKYIVPTAGSTGPEPGELGSALQALFEQAVNAGLVKKADDPTSAPTDREDLSGETGTFDAVEHTLHELLSGQTDPNAEVYGAQWQVDNTLAVYVKFSLTKTREYNLSTETNTHSSASSSVIYFGGVTFDNSSLDTETSTPVDKVYQIVLRTVA